MPQPEVPQQQMQIVRAADVRRSLTVPGDVRSDVAFQNDINALLARFEELKAPWLPLSGTLPGAPVSVVADTTPVPSMSNNKPPRRPRRSDGAVTRFRVVDGGAPVIDLLALAPSPVRVAPPAAPPAVRIANSPAPPPAARAAGARGPRRRA
jgi:hypothetical protein